MKLSLVILSSLASIALTTPIHDHHQHKRDAQLNVVTVYETQIVSKPVDRAVSQTQSAVSSSPDNSLSGSSFQTVLLSGSSSATAAPSSSTSGSNSGSSSASQSSSSSSSSGGSGGSGAGSGAKGITYSPYTNSGSCKDASTIKSDIAKLKDFDLIRLYDTDCSGVENVLAAKGSSQKLFAGIYHINKIQDAVDTLSSAVKNVDGGWDNIHTVSIGNELVNSGESKPSDIKTAIDTARSALKSAGYSGKIVSVDTLVAVQNNDELCQYSDYIAVNSHPFWDGNVDASGAGDFLQKQISNIKSKCGGDKSVLITETGWPTKGDTYGSAVPSKDNQEKALKSIINSCGDQVILFTTYDDLWKSPGKYNVEQYWGIFSDN